MSNPKDVHVVRHGDDWAARRPNTERVPIGVNEGMHSFDMHWASWSIDIYV